ncbi:MAG TPA: class I SAM-dependent methyltransferase [Alphaproteobacteria bacterium]|nr:class I SAM-dependent methyltransferase [Alphaproteobacteria bacterium]
MWPDVIALRNFYATPLGHVVRRMIRRRVREIWPDVKGRNMIALGYPTPFLRYYREEASRLVALMPAEQGALSWSRKTPNIVALTEETQLPLADKSVDFALVAHTLEFTSNPRGMIREIWRVLADGGRLILIVPNRTSIWARTENTPFGHGHSYSLSQLKNFLKENTFAPIRAEHALYIPPSQSRVLLSTASAWEKIGHKWFRNLSGVLIVEATKQIYAGTRVKQVVWNEKMRLAKKLVLPIKN